MKLTVPVGIPDPGAAAETVAVNVMLCDRTEGLADDASVVLVASRLTDCDKAAEALVLKLTSLP